MSRFVYYYVECHYAECHYAECRYVECRGAQMTLSITMLRKTSLSTKCPYTGGHIFIVILGFVMLSVIALMVRLLGSFSLHFLRNFEPWNVPNKLMLRYTRIERLPGDKYSGVLGSLVSYEENEVSYMWPLIQ